MSESSLISCCVLVSSSPLQSVERRGTTWSSRSVIHSSNPGGALCVLTAGWSARDKEHLGEELSDVLINLVRLAERCHVDLPTAVLRKFELNARKYPADRVQGSCRKYTEYTDST